MIQVCRLVTESSYIIKTCFIFGVYKKIHIKIDKNMFKKKKTNERSTQDARELRSQLKS